jgi:hypothetical protein
MAAEILYQRYIVTAFNEAGGYALKMSNAFMSGIPDLLLKSPAWPQPQIWEVKKANLTRRVNTTPLQRQTLRSMKDSGIQVGILLILPTAGRDVILALTRDPEQTIILREQFSSCHYVRKLGENWHEAIVNLNMLVPPDTTTANRPST